MSQTSYPKLMTNAVSGMLADASGSPKDTKSYNNPAVEIPFGRAVAKIAADEDGIELPTSGAADLKGVALHVKAVEAGEASIENAWPTLSSVPVLAEGQVFVRVEEAVTPDDSVFVRHTVNGPLDQLGIFRTDADGGNAVAWPNARFIEGAAADELAVLDVNVP